MNGEEVKESVCRCIDENREQIVAWAKAVASQPELGFKEYKTAQLIRSVFRRLGLAVKDGIAVTGIEGRLTCARPGPCLLLMGEMDAVITRDHPSADPVTGAAHLCGHHLQIATTLGVAFALTQTQADQHLSGKVLFLGTPAEEFIEIEERLRFREEGKIRFLGGKQELIRTGYLDGVDLGMLIHSHSQLPGRKILFGATGNGFMAKSIQFRGKAAHAGFAPHEGINALNAACLSMINIHAQRETFQDSDSIRVHPIITNGGDVVNVVPPDVRMETYVRGRRTEAIADASRKVDRALRAGADAVGAEVVIRNVAGYLPLNQNKGMTDLARENAMAIEGENAVGEAGFMGGSTDMGDLSQLIPAIQPYAGGIQGMLHGTDFKVAEFEAALIYPTKVMAMTIVDLLFGQAETARQIISQFKSAMSKDEYLATLEKMESVEDHGVKSC